MARPPSRARPATTALTAILALAGLLVAPAAAPARAVEPRLDGDLPASAADEILVRYRAGTSLGQRRAIAAASRASVLRTSPDGRTQVLLADGRSPASVRRELAADPAVVAVAPNHRRELAEDVSTEPLFDDLWGLHNTGQPIGGATLESGVADVDIDGLEALASGLGSPNVVVAVIDDGVDLTHPELRDRAWTNPGEAGALAANGIDDDGNGYVDDVHGWDFCNADASVHDAGQDGHGTHVAGTIAASLDGRGTVGVAPGVRLMALKFIDDSGQCGSDEMAVAAIDYAASFGVRIINASWGGFSPSPVLDAAIAGSGALFVAAAGNYAMDVDGGGQPFYPAASPLPNIVSVAAIDQSGRLAAFSNYGRISVDIAAPGTNILSAYPASADCPSPCFGWLAGTSMAVPHVVGVAALIGTHRPTLLAQPGALRSRILATGQPQQATVGRTATGRLVNALRAIDTVRPTVAAPDHVGVSLGSQVGSTTARVVVRWPAAGDDVSGIASYSVKRHGPGGWRSVERSTRVRYVRSTLRLGSAYEFRLRATDRAGNVSRPADSPQVTAILYQDGSSLVTYSPSWRTVLSSSASRGRLHTSRRAGAWAEFRFRGRAFGIVAPIGPTRGRIRVSVDGVAAATVDLYRASARPRVVVFGRSWTSTASHRIRIEVVGTTGRPRVDLDGFVVLR
jgi:subtilisin family serine protease